MANLADILQQYTNIDVTIGQKDWVIYNRDDDYKTIDPQPIASCGHNKELDFSFDTLQPALIDYVSRIREGGITKQITITSI